ncbi:MAG: ABC transporter ATP-binding protein [Clostridia bacterium]|nr:ABC transporter ATP-binding protein [Clostridia bacterium]
MKLMYDMPELDQSVFDDAVTEQEKLMYVVPFTINEDQFVSGWLAITDKKIYKILDGKLLAVWEIKNSCNYQTEVMYGSCGFYATFNGTSTLICQFVSSRHLSRYAVICRACEILAQQENNLTPIEDDTPERFCPKCNRPYVANSTICPNCMDKKIIYKKLFAMTKGLRLMMCVPLFVAAFSVIFSIINPIIQKHAVDDYMLATDGKDKIGGFILVVCCIVLIDFISRALGVFQGRVAAIAGNRFTLMLRSLLYEKITSLSLASISRRPTGELMTRITTDTATIQSFIVHQIPSLFVTLTTFIISLIILLINYPWVAIFIFAPMPLAYLFSRYIFSIMSLRDRKYERLHTKNNYILQDSLSGFRVVKSYGKEQECTENYSKTADRCEWQAISNGKRDRSLNPLLSMLMHAGNYLILFYTYTQVFNQGLTMGELSQITAYANMVYAPLLTFSTLPTIITQFLTRVSKVFEILEETPDINDIDLPIDITIEGNISIRNVTFGYNSFDPVLKDVSVEIKAGEMIGIVGHSGCGKSTLVNLIMRMYEVNSGEIVIDDVNIKDISQNALRSQMGIVLQETFLFNGTIRDNIRYANPFATDDEVIRAAKIANAHEFIMNLPEGYNTKVGNAGGTLSGGERQRIAIARAVIHNPRILILDEATAALDTETEKQIQDALNRLSVGRTTIAIAHRLSTLRNADKLLVIDKGRVAEFGTHAELLKQKGIYYRLVMAQRKMAKGDNQKMEAKVKAEREQKALSAK